jgi:hypothetical protein
LAGCSDLGAIVEPPSRSARPDTSAPQWNPPATDAPSSSSSGGRPTYNDAKRAHEQKQADDAKRQAEWQQEYFRREAEKKQFQQDVREAVRCMPASQGYYVPGCR